MSQAAGTKLVLGGGTCGQTAKGSWLLNTCKSRCMQVMELVELVPLSNSIVGKPGVSGLSVEQRKRLTIAVELVANPSIIFMDEPTSGLDARAAAIVMRTVRNTVNTGRTVVCTIHQPSIDIFEVCQCAVKTCCRPNRFKRGQEQLCPQRACHDVALVVLLSPPISLLPQVMRSLRQTCRPAYSEVCAARSRSTTCC